jgi:hypothetical protein
MNCILGKQGGKPGSVIVPSLNGTDQNHSEECATTNQVFGTTPRVNHDGSGPFWMPQTGTWHLSISAVLKQSQRAISTSEDKASLVKMIRQANNGTAISVGSR